MKIGFIHPTPLRYTGGGVRVHYIARGLVKRGHNVCVVNSKFNNFHSEPDGYKLVEIEQHIPFRPFEVLSFVDKAFKTLRGYDVIDITCPLPNLSALYLNRKKSFKLVYTINEMYRIKDYVEESRIFFLLPYLSSLANLQLPYDKIITVSNFSKQQIIKAGADPNIISVVPNGVDLEFYSSIDIQEKYKRPTMVCISRLSRKKRFDKLIEIVYELNKRGNNTQLIIVGTGPEKCKLEDMIHKYSLQSSVKFTGQVNEEEKATILKKSHVFCFASEQEGFGLAPLEAMACGLPVVASDIPTLHEIFGGSALYANSKEQFVEQLEMLFSDHNLYQERVFRALNKAREYTWDNTALKIAKEYEI